MDRVFVFIVGLCLAGMVSGKGQTIPAEIGRSVTLPCETKELPCVKVEWSRYKKNIIFNVKAKDIKLPEDVPECYQGRVELKDPQNGDMSLVLKNVTAEDEGTYECHVKKESNPSNTDPNKPISTIYLDVLLPPDQRISAVIGGNVTLPCEAKEYKVVKWSRPGVETDSIIFLTDKNSDPEVKSECYEGRVELKGPQNGDVSLVLKNVTAKDKGTYECIGLKASNRSKRSTEPPISTIYLDVHYPPDHRISAVIGGNVTLPCETKEHKVVWSRPGVETESILLLTDKNSDPEVQSERYQGRVELKGPQNGDVSLVLKNVTAKDKGTYECIGLKESNRRKRSNYDQPISTVYLDVRPLSPPDVRHPPPPHVPPPSGGANSGLIVGLLVAAVAAVAAAAALIVFVLKKKPKSSPPPDKEAEKPLQIPPTAADPSIP